MNHLIFRSVAQNLERGAEMLCVMAHSRGTRSRVLSMVAARERQLELPMPMPSTQQPQAAN
jgi:hypothetical protein